MQKNYALFRYPDSNECHVIDCDDSGLMLYNSFECVGNRSGFVFAPFDISPNTPLIVIDNESERVIDLNGITDNDSLCHVESREEDKSSYEADFGKFHSAVCSGKVDKLVLSRKATVRVSGKINPLVLFKNACRDNSHAFVALVSTSASGTWLMATPEILLERNGKDWHTIALAGTMAYGEYMQKGKWSSKNIKEQKFVADYIHSVISKFTDDIQRSEPHTISTGNIVHIRTDFSFYTAEENGKEDAVASIGNIVASLHPTPAVCGLPATAAHDFIRSNESVERKYYSGFCGMVQADGDFNLYVTLRCMNINGNSMDLFAGGGIMPDSNCEDEWRETQYKMQTMARCVDAKNDKSANPT